jgi:hypothetical protein
MNELASTLVAILSGINLAGLIGIILKYFIDKKSRQSLQQLEFAEIRYKCVVILMYALLKGGEELSKLALYRNDILTRDDLIKELETEKYNMLLFAPQSVLDAVGKFMEDCSLQNYVSTVNSMRRHLWGGKASMIRKTSAE